MARAAGWTVFALALVSTAGCVTDQPAPVVDRSIGLSQRQPEQAPREYRVEKGDTLYSIAFRYGLDFRDLAAWNGIGQPYTIYPGQQLQLRQTADEPASGRTQPAAGPDKSVTVQPLPDSEAEPDAAPESDSEAAPSEAPSDQPPSRAEREPESEPEPETQPQPQPEPTPEPAAGPLDWQWPSDGPILSTFADGDSSRNGIDIGGEPGAPVRAAAAGSVVYSGSGLIGYGELIIVKHDKSLLSAYGHNRKRLVQEGDRVQAGQEIAEMGDTGAPRAMLHFEIRENGSPVDPERFLPRR